MDISVFDYLLDALADGGRCIFTALLTQHRSNQHSAYLRTIADIKVMAKDSKKDKAILKEAKERFKLADEAWSINREQALDDLKFARLAEQWPEEIKRQRELEGRPCLTINRLPSFIRQVVNDARLNSPSIKVHPVDDFSDPDTADVINGIIRNIETASNADVAYDSALEDAVTCGFGYFRVNIDYTSDDVFDLDVLIERIANPLSVYFDPHSSACDASDWKWCFVVETMSHDEFDEAYPNADKSHWEGEERDHNAWITDDTVRLAEYWTCEEEEVDLLMLSNGIAVHADQYLENQALFDAEMIQVVASRKTTTKKVTQYMLSGAEVLETHEWVGKHIPIIPVFGDEVFVEDDRFFLSLVRQAKDAQRNFNFWRTGSTELVALAPKAPFVGPQGAFDTDIRKWETANSESHPFIEYDGATPPQRQPFAGVPAGALQEAMNASDDLKSIMGLFDASLGAQSNEVSGRAIMARQREGDVSTFHFIDNLSRGIRYAGKVLLDLIPHVYNKPRIMRIIGIDGSPDSIQINQEFEQNGIAKIYDLTKGKYDLVVDTGPSFTTKREESATQMTEFLRTFPQASPIIGDLVVKNLDWPGAEDIAKRLRAMLPPQIQQMEKMEGLPPEAQSAIAQAQQQMEQMQQVIQQGQQIVAQKDQEIMELGIEKKAKVDELHIKETDSQRDYEAAMAKIDADLQIEAMRAQAKAQQQDFDSVVDDLRSQIISANESMANSFSGIDGTMKNKSITLNTPGGEQYDAVVIDGDITVVAPSGKVYRGQINQEVNNGNIQ